MSDAANHVLVIGIDPGVSTGVAVWDPAEFRYWALDSTTILQAMKIVKTWQTLGASTPRDVFVMVEDARKRKGGFQKADQDTEKYGAGVREAVGSVKRDCSIWEEFLSAESIPHEMAYPRRTKVSPEEFARLTGMKQRTNKHERDAAMLVFQLNRTHVRLKLETYKQQRESDRESALPARARLGRRRRGARL